MRKRGRPLRLSFDLDLYNTTHMHGSAFNKGQGITLSTPIGRWRSFEGFLTFLSLGTEPGFRAWNLGPHLPGLFTHTRPRTAPLFFANEHSHRLSDCIGFLSFAMRRLASQRSHSTQLRFSRYPWRRILWLPRRSGSSRSEL